MSPIGGKLFVEPLVRVFTAIEIFYVACFGEILIFNASYFEAYTIDNLYKDTRLSTSK
jgi:hypothetical protein